MSKLSDYTDDEIDAVIDALDYGFMRNRIKASEADTLTIMNTYTAARVVLDMRLRKSGNEIIKLLNHWLESRGKKSNEGK